MIEQILEGVLVGHVLSGIGTFWDLTVTSAEGQMKMSPDSGDGYLCPGVLLFFQQISRKNDICSYFYHFAF